MDFSTNRESRNVPLRIWSLRVTSRRRPLKAAAIANQAKTHLTEDSKGAESMLPRIFWIIELMDAKCMKVKWPPRRLERSEQMNFPKSLSRDWGSNRRLILIVILIVYR